MRFRSICMYKSQQDNIKVDHLIIWSRSFTHQITIHALQFIRFNLRPWRLPRSPTASLEVFCDLLRTDARQHGIYLFYIITKSLFYFKIFQHNAKAGLLPRRLAFARKKAIKKTYMRNSLLFRRQMCAEVCKMG